MHPSIYFFNQTESKVRLPRELHSKTNAIVLLITALTRSRQSWRTYQGGEPVQVLDNCQLCQWLLFYCTSLCFTAGLHLCPTLMIAFKSPLPAEDCIHTQRSLGKGFSMLTVVDYGWKHWCPVIISAKGSTDQLGGGKKGIRNVVFKWKAKKHLKTPYRLCNLSENIYHISCNIDSNLSENIQVFVSLRNKTSAAGEENVILRSRSRQAQLFIMETANTPLYHTSKVRLIRVQYFHLRATLARF